MVNTNLDKAVKSIQLDELELEQYVAEVERLGCRDDLLECIRFRLVDSSHRKERSIYCGLIREFNDKDALPLLWKLISQDESKGRRGSLVFAMENMNPIEYLEQLVELAIHDNFEVLCNSVDIIDSLEGHVNQDIIENCTIKLKTALASSIPDWRREALTLLLDMFKEN